MKRYYRFVSDNKNRKSDKRRYVIFVLALLIEVIAYAKAYAKEHPYTNWCRGDDVGGITIIQETEPKVKVVTTEQDIFEDTEFVVTTVPEEYEYSETETEITITEIENVTLVEDEYKEFTEEDILWLQKVVFAESRGESQEGQVAVCNVVLNRYYSSEFPDDIKGVILDQKYGKQFETTEYGEVYFKDSNRRYREVLAEDITDTVKESVELALQGTDIAGNRMFFHVYNGKEKHKDQMVIGNHVFY